jgi:hypothetical protein
MSPEIVEKYQVAGLDERERGFNRQAELERVKGQFRTTLRYETTTVVTEAQETTSIALLELIRLLQARGYTQLRSQLSFRGNTYLGTFGNWIEHPDAQRNLRTGAASVRRLWCRLVGKVLGWFSKNKTVSD